MKTIVSCLLVLSLVVAPLSAQIVRNKHFSLGSYGRVGVGWYPNIDGTVGQQMNLKGMGMIGGRTEEQDYLELINTLHFRPVMLGDSTDINVQVRFSFYSTSPLLFGNINSKSLGGIAVAIPELYAEAGHIGGSDWSVWIGAKFFRGGDVHIADHWYFDDHSSQGFGVKYRNTELGVLFVGAVDTTSSLPPYFYLPIINGQPVLTLRQRMVYVLEHTLPLAPGNSLKLMGEFHRLTKAESDKADTTILGFPADHGWVIGAKHMWDLRGFREGSFNHLAVRYGTRIANGGDGGSTRTWLTYGAPNFETMRFSGAYSLSIVEHLLLNFTEKFSLNAYAIITRSRGAAASDDTGEDFLGRETFNQKLDFGVGARTFWYVTNKFHLLSEAHYALRKDGTQDAAGMLKFAILPTLAPGGERSPWSRPHFRLVYALAVYNDFAMENQYSPYLDLVGKERFGHYFGVRAEWWIF